MNILQAMADEALFGPFFRGESWTAWKAFLAALFGLVMDDSQTALYRHHTGRSTYPVAAFREAALVIGRRGGKSRVLALIAVFLAVFRNYAPYLAPGEVATVAIIAADRKQARSIFRFVSGLLNNVHMLSEKVEGETADSITLSNGVVIEIHTASFRVTRGYSLAAALCDEASFWRNDDSAAPDEEILAALRPGLSNIPSSMLLIASSPYARRGALWKIFKQHWGKDDARVLVWRATTREMNPIIDQAIIDEAYEADPASAAAEYGAEFRNDVDTFVSREVIEACTPPGRFELPPLSGTRYHAFVDPSGGSSDSMTLGIAHLDAGVGILDAVRDVRPPFSPESVVLEFAALLKSYGITDVTGDRYAGEWPRERFLVHGIRYLIAEKPKSDIYREILPKMNSGKVELLDIPRLATQFLALERRTARGGRDSIDHPPKAHDDLCNAAAGVLHMVTSGPAPMVISPEYLARLRSRSHAHHAI